MARRALEIVITGDSKGASRAFRGVEKDAGTLTGRLRGVGSAAARTFGILGGAYAASAAVRKITTDTVNFDKSMRNVNSIAQLNEKQYEKLSKSVLKLAGPTAQAPQTLADGLYDLVSSGFDAKDSLTVLESSARAATAGLTTTEVSTKAVAAVLNAYRMPAEKAKDVSDVLFRTVDRGVISFEELSSTVGDVLPFASSLGISLREVGASTATMTKAGIKAPETMTRIKSVMTTLLKPGDDLKGVLKDLGFETGEAIIKQEGFQGALDSIVKTAGGSKEAVAKLFPNIRSLGGVLALTGENSRNAAKDLRGMNDASGATAKALAEQSKSISFQWNRLKAKASELSIQFGMKLVPAMKEVLGVFSDDSLSGTEKLNRIGKVLTEQISVAAEKIPELLAKATPAILKASVLVGKSVAEGIVKGFLSTDLLGKLLIGGGLLRLFGGPGALAKTGAAIGAPMATGMGRSISGGLTNFLGASVLSGGMGRTAGRALAEGMGRGLEMAAPYAIIPAIMLSVQAGMDAFKVFKPVSGGMYDQLDQIEGKGKTLQATMGDLFNKIPNAAQIPGLNQLRGISNALGLGDLKDSAADAGRLKEVLGQINKVSYAKSGILRTEGMELLKNLGLTKDQYAAVKDILDLKPKQAGDTQAGIDRLAGGMITRLEDITRLTGENAKNAAKAYGANSPEWRSAMARNMNAAVSAVRAGMSQGVISTQKGKERIRALLARRDLLTGSDPLGLARGFRKSWVKAGAINNSSIKGMLTTLGKLPKGARNAASQAMLQMAKQLEASGKLPKGSASKLRSAIVTEYGMLASQGAKKIRNLQKAAGEGGRAWGHALDGIDRNTGSAMSGVVRSLDRGSRDAKRKFDGLAKNARDSSRAVKTAITGIPSPVRTAYSALASDANTAAGAFGSNQRVTLGFRGGGAVPLGGGKLTPARVSPGEVVEHKGRRWTVPGRPVAKDSVYAELPVGSAVYTWDGQHRLAHGEPKQSVLRNQEPHFSGGGTVRSPKLSGGNRTGTATGQSGIDMIRKAALKWVEKNSASNTGEIRNYRGVRMADWVIGALEFASKKGVGPQPTSGYRTHAENVAQGRYYISEHEKTSYPGGAVDFGGFTSGLSAKMSVVNATRGYKYPLLAPIGFRDDGHASGTGHRKGGIIQRLGGGGVVKKVANILTRRGFDHKSIAGILGNAYGESNWNTTADDGAGNGGLWGFTSGEKSMASLRAFASNEGTDWRDAGTQTRFMLKSGGAGLKNALNALDSIPDTTKLFMDEYERPGIPRLDVRTDGGFKASKYLRGIKFGSGGNGGAPAKPKVPKLTAKQKKGKSKLLGGAGQALTYAKQVRAGTKRPGLAKKAIKFARSAKTLAGDNKFKAARAALTRSESLAARAAKSIPGLKGSKGPFADRGYDASKPYSFKNLPGFNALPPAVRKILTAPGLSLDGKLELANTALSLAGDTTSTKDDAAAYNLIIGINRRKRTRNARIVRRANKQLRKGGLTKKQQNAIRGRRDAGLVNIGAASTDISSARVGIRGLNEDSGGGSDSDTAQAMKELTAAINEQNRLQSSVQATSGREAIRMLADVMSGQFVGNTNGFAVANPGVRY